MSDASSNPNLEISEGESSLKSPLLETMQNEVQLPAEKVEMPPKRAPAGPEDHFKIFADDANHMFYPFEGVSILKDKMFMNPMFQEVQNQIAQQEEILDRINDQLEQDRKERQRERLQGHIPEPLKGSGRHMKDILQTVEDLMLYEMIESAEETTSTELKVTELKVTEQNQAEEEKKEKPKIPVKIRSLDQHGQAAVTAHSLAAYVSCLNEEHLKKFTTKITSDCQLWLSKMFRFDDASIVYHDEARDGLVKVCRLALYNKYPKYATEGFEALYSRPPVIYLSSAAKPGLSHYLCLQLGLPMSCICTVPCNTLFGADTKLDTEILGKLIIDDLAAAKTPVLLVGFAGTPSVGHVDDLEKLKDLCKNHNIWLHVEGNNLATLALLHSPTGIQDARSGDSLTLYMGTWLGIPALPYITLFKVSDPSLVHAAGLNTFNPSLKLNCLPLWVVLQTLGIEGIEERITHSCDLAKELFDELDTIKNIKQISRDKTGDKEKNKTVRSIGDLITRAISSLLVFEMVTPTVVFKYFEDKTELGSMTVAPYAMGSNLGEEEDEDEVKRKADYYSALNVWLAETLQTENPKVEITAIDVEREGICIRFSPLDSAQVMGTTTEDIQAFVKSLKKQLEILDATVLNYEKFRMVVAGHENLRLVDVSNWAGLGAVQYVPKEYLDLESELPPQGVQEVNSLNMELVHRLKTNDAAFSLGSTDTEMVCVKFGLITEETDVEDLIGMVQTIGKQVEESSKYLESLSEMIQLGIEEANKDLKEEQQHKIYQEGMLRQVPVVGSLLNWWSPSPKDLAKGRRFDLISGTIASTEDTYRYHMQVQESPHTSPRVSESGSNQSFPSPDTKTAGDIKNKLMHVSEDGRPGSPELAVPEGQEATESSSSNEGLTLSIDTQIPVEAQKS